MAMHTVIRHSLLIINANQELKIASDSSFKSL